MAFEGESGASGAGGGETGGAADLLGGGAGGGGDAGAGAAPEWLEKLSAEGGDADNPSNRDWAKAAGVKDPDHAIKLLRDNMRAAREKGGLKLPGADAKPEEIAAFRTAIGVPDKPEGYEVKAPDGVELNQPLIKGLTEAAVKHGLPKAGFEGVVGEFIKLQMDEAAAEATRQDDLAVSWLKEQGGKKDEQLAYVDTAARALNFTKADMTGLRAGLGADRALALLAKLGAGMAEDTLTTGGKGRFGVTGAEAQAEIDRLKADPEFQKKVMVPGSAERQRWDRLNSASAEWQAAKAANG